MTKTETPIRKVGANTVEHITSLDELQKHLGQVVQFTVDFGASWQLAKLRRDPATMRETPPYINGNLPTTPTDGHHKLHDFFRFTEQVFAQGCVVKLVAPSRVKNVSWSFENC